MQSQHLKSFLTRLYAMIEPLVSYKVKLNIRELAEPLKKENFDYNMSCKNVEECRKKNTCTEFFSKNYPKIVVNGGATR